MKLDRLVFAFGLAAVVFAACAVESPSDDDSSGSPSTSGGPGPTELCEEECLAQLGAGDVLYRELRTCLMCQACADACANEDGGLCEGAAQEGGCSAMFPTCAECLDSPCALAQRPDTMFDGFCAPQGNACAADVSCVSFNNCVASCASMPPSGGMGGTGGAGGAGGATTM